jgi:hypothetical protein
VVAGLDELRSQLISITLATAGAHSGHRPSRSTLRMRNPILIAAAILMAGCTTNELPGVDSRAVHRDSSRADSAVRARQDSINRATPGYVIDSLLPTEEEARRFRADHPGDSATSLRDGATSRDALVRRFVRAVAEADSTDLRRMVVTPREFVDVYYPRSPYASGPYHQPVGFAWQMIQNPSEAGLRKLLRRAAGHPLTVGWQRCEPTVLHEGAVDRYTGCLVRIVDDRGDSVTKRLFGSIVSYRGAFKFLSYTNDM